MQNGKENAMANTKKTGRAVILERAERTKEIERKIAAASAYYLDKNKEAYTALSDR